MKLTPSVWVNTASLYDNNHHLMFVCTTVGNQPATLDNLCCKLEYIHEARRITTQSEDQLMAAQVTELKNRDAASALVYIDLFDAPHGSVYQDKENDLWRFNHQEDRWEWLPFELSDNYDRIHPASWSRIAPGTKISELRNLGPFRRYRFQ